MKYYYLITSLPELSLDLEKLPISRSRFEEKLHDALDGRDAELFGLLKLRIDNQNLSGILSHKDTFKGGGTFDGEDLKERIKFQYGLPSYMMEFLTRTAEPSGKLIEDILWGSYLDFCMEQNLFLEKYFTFERNIKNIVSGIYLKKFKNLSVDRIISADDFVTESIKTSNMQDFGLGKEIPCVSSIIEFIENKQYFELERYIDALRFDIIDELNQFNYFTIEQVLGYSIQLEIVERWIRLSEEQGKKYLKQLSEKDVGKTDLYEFEIKH